MRKKIVYVYVDVDDTLVRTVGTTRIPLPAAVAQVRSLAAGGECALYCWSSGGADYARASAAELGVQDCFIAFLPKPDIYIDDQAFEDWRYCRHVLPGNDLDFGD